MTPAPSSGWVQAFQPSVEIAPICNDDVSAFHFPYGLSCYASLSPVRFPGSGAWTTRACPTRVKTGIRRTLPATFRRLQRSGVPPW